ncbi:MAG: hypothetical protein A2Z31_06540 [candidate division NC10 bacterium RBG_16_65_8]|nr:MAG: hypothetical protein A2Z31_06540 [candidate division NC10 bacterium RBG_16_65_8]
MVMDGMDREVLDDVLRTQRPRRDACEAERLPASPELREGLVPEARPRGQPRRVHEAGVQIDAVGEIGGEKILLPAEVGLVAAAPKQSLEPWSVGRSDQQVHIVHRPGHPSRVYQMLQRQALEH